MIATDVGGTSFDVGLIVDGDFEYTYNPVFSQYRLHAPIIDIKSIGAGGGSIAWIEEKTGLLKVGPKSAGALPGPVCYGRGGEQPTVTDANVVLGRIDPENFLGGRMRLDKRYHGELAASGQGQMLAFRSAVAGSAGYVAMELVDGTLGGRRGSFVLQHSGTLDRGAAQLDLGVVPDSGTGELIGLRGRMNIVIAEGGKHRYDFE